MRILSNDDVSHVMELSALLDTIADAFRKDAAGEIERPERPHVPVGAGLNGDRRTDADPNSLEEPMGTGLVMPAYIHSSPYFTVKLASVHPGNAARGLPTVNATIALIAADTGLPVAYMAGTRITNARTGCIGGLSVRDLAVEGALSIGVIGSGAQARWQVKAIAAAREITQVSVYSRTAAREECAADLRDQGIPATAVESSEEAVRESDVVVTATTATSPVFDGAALSPGTLVVAVGAYEESMRELDDRTVDRADRLFADVPAEAAETGDLPQHDAEALTPLSAVFTGEDGRANDEEVIVVKSVGTAVLDAATAEFVYERATESDVGTAIEI